MRFPAGYSRQVLAELPNCVPGTARRVLDPFAGPTGIRNLRSALGPERAYLGIELEPEWAEAGEDTLHGDCILLPYDVEVEKFAPDVIVTSPPYGNRMADQYLGDAKGSTRHTYAIALGRKLTRGSAAAAQWGPKYQERMKACYEAIALVCTRYEAPFVLNIADHYRKGKVQNVSAWTVETLLELGFTLNYWKTVKVPSIRHGRNHELRVEDENIFVLSPKAA